MGPIPKGARRLAAVIGVVQLSAVLAPGWDLHAQQIPRAEYLRYVPLNHPEMVRQRRASAELALYGDPENPRYRDVDPADGIDDRRHRVLVELAVRFAPLLVLNSTAVPMDFRRFMEREPSFPLYVDRWDVSGDAPRLLGSEEIDWRALSDEPCRLGSSSASSVSGPADCRLLALLEEFDPLAPGPAYLSGAVEPDRDPFKVLFFDFPGEDEESWREEYEDRFSTGLPRDYESFPRVYVHPFVQEVRSGAAGPAGYELVLQYWLFYPFNDGGNNHEGDWEHINVVVSPRSKLHEPLTAEELRGLLTGGRGSPESGVGRLVVRRVDYYFHHNVMVLDYTRPNVYAPREEWERELDGLVEERRGEKWFWRRIRHYAYRDDAETTVNTHPIGFIGADNKGTDQLLHPPGGSNRDSHGTYPFPGLYKDVGPAGAAEQISQRFDHREYFAGRPGGRTIPEGGYRRGSVADFASPDRVEIVPDGERVVELVRRNARARREWAWLVLPLRWGYPAAESPFAGIIAHAETGNISVVGPAYNGGWNRSGDAAGFHLYAPHRFGSLFPLTWQDGFANNLGYLNLTFPTLAVLPPFDFLWRVVAAPFRVLFDTQNPIYQDAENIPYRFLGLSGVGGSHMVTDAEFVNLFLNERQVNDIGERIATAVVLADSVVGEEVEFVDDATVGYGEISLYLGRRFASENTLRHGRAKMGIDIVLPTIGEVFELRGDLNFWEYSGSIRYNLTDGAFMPFVKGGYGISWYRVENATTNGDPLPEPDGPWVGRPGLGDLSSLLPNTWHIGGGFEWVPLRSVAAFPRGIDLGIRADALLYRHSLGLSIQTAVPTPAGIDIAAGPASSPTITRPVYNLALTVSF